MRFVKIFSAALAAAVLLCSCGERDLLASTGKDKKIVMTVGNSDVQYQEYRYFLLNNKRDSFPDSEPTADEYRKLREMTMENIRYRHTLDAMSEKYGYSMSDEDKEGIEAYAESYRASFGDDEIYKEELEQRYLTHELFKELVADSIKAEGIVAHLMESGVIASGDEDKKEAVLSDDLLCLKEIYVSLDRYGSYEAAQKVVNEAAAELEKGESFESVMRQYSDYTDEKLSVEYGYYTAKYDALDEVWETAQTLEEGKYSEPIQTEYGYHIIMKCPKNREYALENIDEIFNVYAKSRFYELFYDIYDETELQFTKYGEKLIDEKIE